MGSTERMETIYNYYGVEKGTEKYDAVVNSNIVPALNTCFKVQDVYKADLVAEAEAYLMEDLCLSADEVVALKVKLGSDDRIIEYDITERERSCSVIFGFCKGFFVDKALGLWYNVVIA